MILGMQFPTDWVRKSEEKGIALSDILYGVAVEDLLTRIEASNFREYLWLTNEQAVGEEAYKKKVKERLTFLYVESGKKNYLSHAVAGDAMDEAVLQLLLKELFARNDMESCWDYIVSDSQKGKTIALSFMHLGMQVPVQMDIRVITGQTQKR